MVYDIAIIGAGPVGLSFALSLKALGLKIVVIEKQTAAQLADPADDGREIALTHLSKQVMQTHGSWQALSPEAISPIAKAKVANGASPYLLNFEQPPRQDKPLGYLVANHAIRRAIYQTFQANNAATLIDQCTVTNVSTDENGAQLRLDNGKTIHSKLIVAADTRFSKSRRQMGIATDSCDYGRTAILCRVTHEKPHEQTAFECFLYGGTLATLPLNNQTSGIVITVDNTFLDHWLNMSDETLNAEVANRLNHRLGQVSICSQRFHYPLIGTHAQTFYANRYAIIGDAAVGMHPVTAQGFNLGLNGQTQLANEITLAHSSLKPFWTADVLKRYQQKQMSKTRILYHGTNKIVRLFTNESRRAKLMRHAVLRLSNRFPPIKRAVVNQLTSTH